MHQVTLLACPHPPGSYSSSCCCPPDLRAAALESRGHWSAHGSVARDLRGEEEVGEGGQTLAGGLAVRVGSVSAGMVVLVVGAHGVTHGCCCCRAVF